MPKFSKTSKARLATCHKDLQTIFEYAIRYFDCTIVCGHRTREKQEVAYAKGYSKVRFPNSKHNSLPSMAADVAPFPIEWDDLDRMRYFAGYVMGVAQILKDDGDIKHSVRWGGDWDRDTEVKDNTFQDLVHFELR